MLDREIALIEQAIDVDPLPVSVGIFDGYQHETGEARPLSIDREGDQFVDERHVVRPTLAGQVEAQARKDRLILESADGSREEAAVGSSRPVGHGPSEDEAGNRLKACLLYTSPSPRDGL